MSFISRFTARTGQAVGVVQSSLSRARLEGERRALVRHQRAEYEALGRRVVELVDAGLLPDEQLSTELAAVRSTDMEIAAKTAEIDPGGPRDT